MLFRSMRYLLIALLSFSTVAGTAASAVAQTTTIVTEKTQRTIGYDQSWSETSRDSDADTGLEFVTLDHKDGGRVGFIFSSDQLDQAQVRDATLERTKTDTEDYTVIDSGQYDNVAYELAHFKTDGEKLGIFVLVVNTPAGTTVVMVTGEVDAFKDAVGRVQAGVTLDGVPVLQGVDGASLQTQLQVTQASSVTTSSELPAAEANESETSAQPTGNTATGAEFTSPSYGFTVTYGAPWESGNQGIGELDLLTYSPLTVVSFQGVENAGFSGQDFELVLLETFIEFLGPGGEFVGSSSTQSSAVFIGASGGMVLIQEVIAVSPTVAVIVTAVADGSADADVVIANLRTIRVNGTPLLSPMG